MKGFPAALERHRIPECPGSVPEAQLKKMMALKRETRQIMKMQPMKSAPKKAQPEFFRSNILVHTHIQKTAGTTLVEGLTASLGGKHVLDLRSGKNRGRGRLPDNLTNAEKKDVWLISGHFNFGRMDRFFARKKLYIASVRPPFARFRSYFEHVSRTPNHPHFKNIENRTFSQALREHLERKLPQAHNQMARMLTNIDNPSKTELLDVIEQHYLLISPYKQVNDAIQALSTFVGLEPLEHSIHKNKAPKKDTEEVGELEEQFNEVNQLDRELYELAETQFDSWLATLAERQERILGSAAAAKR